MRYLAIQLLIIFLPLYGLWQPDVLKNCQKPAAATLVSLQGTISFDPSSKGHWQTAQINDSICEGGRVRVEINSLASLRLTNGTVLHLLAGSELTLNAISKEKLTAPLPRLIIATDDFGKTANNKIATVCITHHDIQGRICTI